VSTGAGKFVSRFTGAYSMVRTQFNTPIGNFEGIEEVLTRVAGKTYQMEAARLLTLSALDCGENPSVISAIIKYHLTENMRSIVNDAMDIHGGSGICLGPRNIIGRVYQAIPVCITVEGANILTRCMIIFGQGAIRCHPFVLKEINATANKDRQQALINFDDAFFGHIGFYISNKTRAFTLGLTRGWIATSPVHGPSERYFQYMSWMSAGYALTVDTCMSTLGGALKRKEKISARLGDILSELYILSAVVKNFEERGRPEDEEDILKWSCQDSLYKIQQSYIDLFQNLPFRPAAWFLRIAIFPTGFPFSKPSDNLGKKVADLIRKPSDIRDRLTSGIYLSKNIDDATGRLDIALEKSIESAPLHKKLSAAKKRGEIKSNSYEELINQTIDKGILTAEEANLLRQAYRLKSEVIAVSSFSADSFKS
jgi:acyl-CoA dehydrogenase